jgi:cytochrome c-type biogenesis protein CcmH/NrfG
MSRLADRLMGMDRGLSRRDGLGSMPLLVASARVSARWRPRAVLVIVVACVVFSVMALIVRTKSTGPDASGAPGRIVAPAPIPSRPRSDGADERFVALSSRGLQAAREGALAEAAGLLTKALEVQPAHADTWNTLGVILARQGEMARAVEAFSYAVRMNPNHAEAHRNLAVVLDRQGRFREAVVHYRSFLNLTAESRSVRDEVRRRLAELSVPASSGLSE